MKVSELIGKKANKSKIIMAGTPPKSIMVYDLFVYAHAYEKYYVKTYDYTLSRGRMVKRNVKTITYDHWKAAFAK